MKDTSVNEAKAIEKVVVCNDDQTQEEIKKGIIVQLKEIEGNGQDLSLRLFGLNNRETVDYLLALYESLEQFFE